MSFELDVITIIRHMIDDLDCSDQEYTDDRLLELIFIAANYTNLDIDTEYTISISEQSISPAPDSHFTNLVALKATCMLLRSAAASYAKFDFKVTDGPSTVDLKDIAQKLQTAADNSCKQYSTLVQRRFMGEGGYVYSTPRGQ